MHKALQEKNEVKLVKFNHCDINLILSSNDRAREKIKGQIHSIY